MAASKSLRSLALSTLEHELAAAEAAFHKSLTPEQAREQAYGELL